MSVVSLPHERLKEKVEELYSKRKRAIRKQDFDIFHYSVQQKLWEADYYAEQIRNFNSEDFRRLTPDSSATEPDTETVRTIFTLDKENLSQYCNLYIDGYFISVMGIFDSLAHEVNVLFKLKPDPNADIYFPDIAEKMKKRMPNSHFYKYIYKEILHKRWWKTLKNFIEDFHKNIQSTIEKAYKRLIKHFGEI